MVELAGGASRLVIHSTAVELCVCGEQAWMHWGESCYCNSPSVHDDSPIRFSILSYDLLLQCSYRKEHSIAYTKTRLAYCEEHMLNSLLNITHCSLS